MKTKSNMTPRQRYIKLNQLIDEMQLIERYAIWFGKTGKRERNLCIHKDRFYRLIEKQKSFEEGKSLMIKECNKLVDRNRSDFGTYDYKQIAEDLIKYLKDK